MKNENKINLQFFLTDAITLAKNLLGKILIRNINGKIIKARIVETEAYMGVYDRASHSYGFKVSPKTAPLYQIGGTIYVYLIYGMYYCFNIVCNFENNPQAVLIRAVEIISGDDIVKENLSFNNRNKSKEHWTNGPGKLAIALKIDKTLNQTHLLNNPDISLIADNFIIENEKVVSAKRINIDYANEDKDHLWRFYLKNNQFVSKIVK